jgi:DnaK suppressor protein
MTKPGGAIILIRRFSGVRRAIDALLGKDDRARNAERDPDMAKDKKKADKKAKAAAKDTKKATAKAAAKPSKAAAKPAAKVAAKAPARKPAVKAAAKPVAKAPAKTAAKPAAAKAAAKPAKPAAKAPAKPAAKPAAKAAPAKPAVKAAAKPATKAAPAKPAAKAAAKPAPAKAPAAAVKPALKVVAPAKPAVATKPEPKKPEPKKASTGVKLQPVKPINPLEPPANPHALIHGQKPYIAKPGEEYMSDAQLAHFRRILLAWKQELMEEVDRTVHHMQDESANLPDPNDRATQEEEFALELRTRDRERKLIKKIEKTLGILDGGDYGYCQACGIEIGIRRLEARPTAELCIDCKTLAEIKERQVGSAS